MAFKVVETDSKVLPSIKSFRLSFLIYWASGKLFMLTYQIYAGDFGDRSSCEINESRWYSKSHHPSIPRIPEHVTRTHTTQCIYSILFQILSVTAFSFSFLLICSWNGCFYLSNAWAENSSNFFFPGEYLLLICLLIVIIFMD